MKNIEESLVDNETKMALQTALPTEKITAAHFDTDSLRDDVSEESLEDLRLSENEDETIVEKTSSRKDELKVADEEAILNKFDSSQFDDNDVDAKLEDSLLSEQNETKKQQSEDKEQTSAALKNEKVNMSENKIVAQLCENGEKKTKSDLKDVSVGKTDVKDVTEEDLLQVMDVQPDADEESKIEDENKDENSSDSTEKNITDEVEVEEVKIDEDNLSEEDMEIETENVGKINSTVLGFREETSNADTLNKTRADSQKKPEEEEVKRSKSKNEVSVIEPALEDDLKGNNKKRSLSDTTADLEEPKKAKMDNKTHNMKRLQNISQYMVSKKLKKLTRNDLEELCLQKICEVLGSRSEIGELRHQLQAQEQLLEQWRKDTYQIAKQARDLHVVHTKLLSELKIRRSTDKPVMPVKITRSVGLQAYVSDRKPYRPIFTPSPVVKKQNVTPRSNTHIIIPRNLKVSPQNGIVRTKTVQKESPKTVANKAAAQSSPLITNTKKSDIVDLTDEEEKPVTKTVTKALVTTPVTSGTRIMLMPCITTNVKTPVVLKVNSGTNNVVTTQPQTISIIPHNVVRTVQRNGTLPPLRSITAIQQNPAKAKHPAPLPVPPLYQGTKKSQKLVPPKPHLNLTKSACGTGIVLQWKMPYKLDAIEDIASYQLFAYQETNAPPKSDNWGKIGDVKALALPMAVTLTQFAVGNRYYFAVRAVDVLERVGPFSDPQSILL